MSRPFRMPIFKPVLVLAAALVWLLPAAGDKAIASDRPAKQLFGAQPLPADMAPSALGFYSRGCLAGGIAIPVDGPAWQVMRLSRNRRWGHPDLIALIDELSVRAKKDGWNGLMVGDISQPRGGPMLTGHRSHQVGLDVDLWFMPMPDRRLSYREREELSAISVLKKGTPYVEDARWTKAHERVLYHAAAFPQVQRILVHPGVKKKLCDTVRGDRKWLAKIRPFYGHHYHFHVRIHCPEGSKGCTPQKAVGAGTGCDESLDWWFNVALKPKPKPSKPQKPKKPRELQLANLPEACRVVLKSEPPEPARAEYALRAGAFTAPRLEIPKFNPQAILASRPIEASKRSTVDTPSAGVPAPGVAIPVPTPRPGQ